MLPLLCAKKRRLLSLFRLLSAPMNRGNDNSIRILFFFGRKAEKNGTIPPKKVDNPLKSRYNIKCTI